MHFTERTTSPLHTASPSAASNVTQCPSASDFPKPTQKPLTIRESPLWHRRGAHINPTTLPSLIDGYSKHYSMCTTCIQAKHEQKIMKVKTKSATKLFEFVHSDVWRIFSTLTSTGHRNYIRFIYDYTCYTSVWVPPEMKSKACTSAYQSFKARVDPMGYEVKLFLWDNGRGAYDSKTFRLVFAAHGTTYQPCPPYAHQQDGVAKSMIQTTAEKARSNMNDSQAPFVIWREALNATDYLPE